MNELEIVDREEFGKFIRKHKELDGKPFESNIVCSMMFVDANNWTIAQAIYYKSGKPIYKIRRDYNASNRK